MKVESNDVRHVVAWLPVVRWATCLLLWTVIGTAWLFPHLDLSLRAVAPVGLIAAFCRTVIAWLFQKQGTASRALVGCSLGIDAALLTGLLDITGGPFNPFIVMFVTYVWLAAVRLSPRWGALVGVVSAIGFGWLVVDHVHAEMAEHHRLNDFPTHLFTMWFSGAAIAELVAHYVERARLALALRQQQVDEARERATRSERLSSLTTLAAGAAHELSTPLATIAVAAVAANDERTSSSSALNASPSSGSSAISTPSLTWPWRIGTTSAAPVWIPAFVSQCIAQPMPEHTVKAVRHEREPTRDDGN